jgi:hypothetical protein
MVYFLLGRAMKNTDDGMSSHLFIIIGGVTLSLQEHLGLSQCILLTLYSQCESLKRACE